MEETEQYPDAVQKIKDGIEDRIKAEEVSRELLDQVLPVVESKRKFAEAQQALSDSITKLVEAVNNLAQINIEVNDRLNELYRIQKEEYQKTLAFYKKVEEQF